MHHRDVWRVQVRPSASWLASVYLNNADSAVVTPTDRITPLGSSCMHLQDRQDADMPYAVRVRPLPCFSQDTGVAAAAAALSP